MFTELANEFVGIPSLNWAIAHIQKYGDTDIFPTPFEYNLFKSIWPEVLTELKQIDISIHELSASLKMMSPKHITGFRAATQMDPIDAILFTALIYEISEPIENFRICKDDKIACSYRILTGPDGQFFSRDNGWNDYLSKSEELSNDPACKYVLTADISDFYNQISHHRVQNALASTTISENRSKTVERLLKNHAALHHSRGVPVGPSASIPLAEICLSDVDLFLMRKGHKHTRYVDDFRIFCESKQAAITALHNLSEYLYKSHRLTLQSHKTTILDVNVFRQGELFDPEKEELKRKENRIADFIDSLDIPPYTDPDDFEIDDDAEAEFTRETIRELFIYLLSQDHIHLGLARYLLRRATILKTRVILQLVLDNIVKLLPALREVAIYLIKVYDKSRPEQIGDVLLSLLQSSDYKNIPYIQYWVLEIVSRNTNIFNQNSALFIAESANPYISERMSALIAKNYNIIDWVRERKETWQTSQVWAQRAIIYASSILPKDERNHWLKQIENYPDLGIRLTAKATRHINN